MKEFLKLNKHKLSFAYKFITILYLCASVIFLILAKIYQNPSSKLLIQILIIGGILFPIFILFILYLNWVNEKRYYNKFIIAKISKDKNSFGYSKKLINESSKWFFTKKILSKNINGFEIEIKFEYETIGVYVYAINENIEKTKRKYFEEKSKKLNFENFVFRLFFLKIKRKSFDEITFKEIEIKLAKFVNLLEEYNYKPE